MAEDRVQLRDDSALSSSPPDAPVKDRPAWFTPLRLLAVFCVVNMVVYMDRGVIASNGVNGSPRTEDMPSGTGIQGEFNLTNVQDGLLATAFMVGLLLASPLFSEACKHYSAFRLMGIGMGSWVIATTGCGLAPGFVMLLLARMLVGVGEASFVALAAPFIDDYAPAEQKARWFAAFYLCIPTGFALGYVYGGLVSAALGWRAAFLIESAIMVPFVVFAFMTRPLHLRGMHDMGGADPSLPRTPRQVVSELGRDVLRVASHRVWVTMVVAYTLYVAVLGTYAFWGPKAGSSVYSIQGETADLVFGAMTILTGIVGSLAGGLALDAMGGTLRNAATLCAASSTAGFLLCMPAFLLAPTYGAFMALLALGELALFTIQAPIGALGMWAVPPSLRPLAISLTTVAIHVFGDVPSPPLVGWLESKLEAGKPPAVARQQWRYSMAIITVLLAAAGAVFALTAWISRPGDDYRRVRATEEEAGAEDAEERGADSPADVEGLGSARSRLYRQDERGRHEPLLEPGGPNRAAGPDGGELHPGKHATPNLGGPGK